MKHYRIPFTHDIGFREQISLLYWEVESWLKRLKDFDLVTSIIIHVSLQFLKDGRIETFALQNSSPQVQCLTVEIIMTMAF